MIARRPLSTALSALVLFLVLAAPAGAIPGERIANFGSPIGRAALGGAAFGPRDAVVLADGGILLVGCNAQSDFIIAKLSSIAGDLDPSFGSGGVVQRQLGTYGCAQRVAELADGSIQVAGYHWSPPNYGAYSLVGLRFDAQGNPVAGYGTNGVGTFSLGGQYGGGNAFVIEPSGAVVVLGSVQTPSFVYRLARLRADGFTDTTFGTAGFVELGTSQTISANGLARDAAGGLLVGGASQNQALVRRYTATGQPDPSYATAGTLALAGLESINDLVAGPGGDVFVSASVRINVPGASFSRTVLLRLGATGVPDATYGGSGQAVLLDDPVYANFRVDEIVSLGGGAIAVGGLACFKLGNLCDIGVAVLDASGLPDVSFNAGIIQTIFLGTDSIEVNLLSLGADFGIVTGSDVTNVARILADGSVDPTLGRLGTGIVGVDDLDFQPYESPVGVAVIGHERIVVGSTRRALVANSWVYVASELTAYTADGVPDESFGIGGRQQIADVAAMSMLRVDDQDRPLVGAYRATREVVVVRRTPEGLADASFGDGGEVELPLPAGQQAGFITDIAIDELGRLVVGVLYYTSTPAFDYDRALYRLEPDGTLDPTFGNGGVVLTDTGEGTGDLFNHLALTPNGIVVSGPTTVGLTRDGAIDPAFGVNGSVPVNGNAIAVLRDGRILISTNQAGSTIVCLLPNGTIDTSFGIGGYARPPATAWSIASFRVQADGAIVAAATYSEGSASGTTAPDMGLLRFTPGGQLDATFGSSGVVRVAFGSDFKNADQAYGVALDGALGIVLMGTFADDRSQPGYRVMLTRHEGGAVCGDGVVQGSEACDEGLDGVRCCTDTCQIAGVGTACRPAVGDCDAEESCDGTSPVCPGDAFVPSGEGCASDGNACTVDVCDGSGTCAHGALPDTDGDLLCDDQDDCTNVNGARDFYASKPKPRLVVSKIGADATPGNDGLKLTAGFDLPSANSFAAVNPLARGARILVLNHNGAVEIDQALPGGAYDDSALRGWKTNAKRNVWQYVDKSASPLSGITSFKVTDKSKTSPGQVRVSLTSKKASYSVDAGDEPLEVLVVLGDQTDAIAGYCGESDFRAADCTFNGAETSLTCKK